MDAAASARAALDEGIRAHDEGRYQDALSSFEKSASLVPTARALNNAGMALVALQRRDDAEQAFERALRLDSRHALANFNLARLVSNRDASRAFALAQVAVQADPANADAWLLVTDLLRRRQDYDHALRAVNLAIERAPQRAVTWTTRAAMLSEMDEPDAARDEFAAAWSRFPADLRAALGANLSLPHVYSSHAQLEAARAAYSSGLALLHHAADRFRWLDAGSALNDLRWTNFYLAYQGHNDRDLQSSFGDFQQRLLQRAVPQFLAPRKRRSRSGRIRVGFLSHYFYNSVVGRYFASWVKRLDGRRFERFVYYTNAWVGDDTRAIQAAADAFRHVAGLPLAATARQVMDDELDVLVYPEIGMHPDTVALSALRLAPVQCMAWGHPTTSGSPQIDQYISCAAMEGVDAPSHYRERLALLPGLGTHYAMPELAGEARRAEFDLPEDRTLYLAPQSLFKMHPDNDPLIAQVLAQDPHADAVMFEASRERSTRIFRSRLDAALAAHGVGPERVRMLKPDLPHAAYLRLNAACDVMLDSVHWSGGNTSIDAIAAALPIVTLPGSLMRGRQSAAMLAAMEMSGLVAGDAAEYVAKAVNLGRNGDARREAAAAIRERRAALFSRDEPIRALEDLLEAAVIA
jgi:predicted O-linked N-acetylglucosamine transferase (SPINDLY family)